MRESLRQRSDTKANQATFKLLFPTVLCLMPAVYLFLLGPALIELSDFFNNGGLDSVSSGINAVQDLNILEQ
jgi:tight adherence protein C